MLVIELTDDKFGKAMHNIGCIEEKLAEIKKIFEDDSTSGNFRRWMPREEDRYYEDRYRDMEYPVEPKHREYARRYM